MRRPCRFGEIPGAILPELRRVAGRIGGATAEGKSRPAATAKPPAWLANCYWLGRAVRVSSVASGGATETAWVPEMKIALFLPNWLGDLVMATPTLRAIRRHYPAAHLVGIMRPYLADVLAGTNWLDEQWYYHPRAKEVQWTQWRLVRRMRHERFDVAVLFPNSLRTALLARLGGARQRIGYSRYGRGPLLTHKLHSPCAHRSLGACPMVDYYLRLAEALGCPPESRRLELATLEKDEASADAVWARLGLRQDGRVIALNSGSSNGTARFWPSEYFGQLANRLATEQEHDVLVMCGPKEVPIARQIVAFASHPRVFSMADQPLDLGTAKACIRRCRLMISTDSGPRHVAAAFGRPVVTLRGPTLPETSENPTVVAIDLRLDLDCIGCQNRICPLGHHRCMVELTPEMVYAEVARFLNKARQATHAA